MNKGNFLPAVSGHGEGGGYLGRDPLLLRDEEVMYGKTKTNSLREIMNIFKGGMPIFISFDQQLVISLARPAFSPFVLFESTVHSEFQGVSHCKVFYGRICRMFFLTNICS